MKTLTFQSWQRLRAWSDELPLLALWIAAFAGIELLGRGSSSEFSDAVGVVALLGLTLATGLRHVRRPLKLVKQLEGHARRALGWLMPLRIRIGLDLRERPPLAHRVPAVLELAVLLAVLLPTIAFLARASLPGSLRELVRTFSPSVHTLWLTLSWGALAVATVWQFRGPLSYLSEAMSRAPGWRPFRRPVLTWLGAGYALWLVIGGTLLPAWLPLALAGTGLVPLAALAHAPDGPQLAMVWQRLDRRRPAASLRWTWLISALFVGYLGAATTLVFLSVGDGLGGELGNATPVSHVLGLAFAWTIPGHVWTAVFHLDRILWHGRRENPAQPLRPRVYVEGAPGPFERRRVRKALEPAGFELAFPTVPRDPSDVVLTIDERAPAPTSSEPAAGPQRVALEHVGAAHLRVALWRRHELLQRELVVRGLERALSSARGTDGAPSGDVWIAPHYWFVTHVTRGEEEREQLVGRPYRELIPLRARAHAYAVLRSLEVDLVVVEGGVRFDELARVLAILFEYYDVSGGERLADERPFGGIPRLRVVLHEHLLDEPFRAKGYPEPDYENIGRARILHLFRDRGGEVDDALAPFDLDWEPSPSVPQLVG